MVFRENFRLTISCDSEVIEHRRWSTLFAKSQPDSWLQSSRLRAFVSCVLFARYLYSCWLLLSVAFSLLSRRLGHVAYTVGAIYRLAHYEFSLSAVHFAWHSCAGRSPVRLLRVGGRGVPCGVSFSRLYAAWLGTTLRIVRAYIPSIPLANYWRKYTDLLYRAPIFNR